jgi:hypothetical protein
MTIFDRDSLRHRVIANGSTMTPLSRGTFLAGALATGMLSTLPASRRTPRSVWSPERERWRSMAAQRESTASSDHRDALRRVN